MRWFWQRKKETPEEQSPAPATTTTEPAATPDIATDEATTAGLTLAAAANAAELDHNAVEPEANADAIATETAAVAEPVEIAVENKEAENSTETAADVAATVGQGDSQSEPAQADIPEAPADAAPKRSWFQRLTAGLARSSNQVSQGITSIFTQRKLDDDMVEELEDVLIASDVGVSAAGRISTAFAKGRFDKEISPSEVREALADAIADELMPVEIPFALDTNLKPHVVLVVGVNGSGKTTTIGKLAHHMRASGHSVMMAAGDTFRAAAIEQLKIWGDRTGATVIAGDQGSDPAALAFDAVSKAQEAGVDLLLIDTAGRLHNKTDLMDELNKIDRVIKKVIPDAPHSVLLVLDATIGQNALAQVKTFQATVPLTGLIVTKLDGTAKGGVLVALADQFKLPVHAIGVGETAEDLQPFEARDFAQALVGSNQAA